MTDKFFKINFTSECIYLGERIKKGTFKPSISPQGKRYKQGRILTGILPVPYSTITGALRSLLGEDAEIHAIGKMTKYNVEYMSIAPYDSALVAAKLPITVEYLSNVAGEVYVKKTDTLPSLQAVASGFVMGGMKSKGFGACKVGSINEEYQPKIIEQEGRFLSRIYYDDAVMGMFGIQKENIVKAYWGYLFRRTSEFNGYYQKSLFEQSIVKNSYDFLVEVMK
jgi:hypothetical protein